MVRDDWTVSCQLGTVGTVGTVVSDFDRNVEDGIADGIYVQRGTRKAVGTFRFTDVPKVECG